MCSHSRQHRWFQRIDECQCDLISKVRADQDMVAYAKHLALDYEHTREAWEAGYKEGKAAASAT
jgi:hypothetical protein